MNDEQVTLSRFAHFTQDWQQCTLHFLQGIYEHSRSAASYDIYQRTLFRFFAYREPQDATNGDVAEFLCTRYAGRPGPVSTATRNTRLGILNSFYEYASKYQIRDTRGKPKLLFTGIKPTLGFQAAKTGPVYRSLTDEQITRFFSVIPNTITGLMHRALFLTYLLTTRRRSELLNLTWGSIERGMVHDESGKIRPGMVYRYRGKGKPGEERVELPPLAWSAIETYLVASGRMGKMKAGDPLFASAAEYTRGKRQRDGVRVVDATLHDAMKRYVRKAGLPEYLCIHSWRHTGIQQRIHAGQPLLSIMKISGHASLDSFYRYAHYLQGEADEWAKPLEAKFKYLAARV